ncbi:CTP synthase [Venustampulla echinocandica]|uniref:CTP synthase n=1 Tax=Venustampulla echinocandica TaxID=2656787 RepID=A0A370TMH8_9HELO|nr:CTP synthase [Venustampulla echinocandica]RDL36730.1 CTP synthase [Venustampulla echinocandica]
MKYVLVSGGVISGIGKGIIASSSGLLLKTLGLKVTAIKIDPYLNIDAGTMSPKEHGECFVLKDGGESDLDLGNYERYLSLNLTKESNITTGKIYNHVLSEERKGTYLGKTVQVVPHITDAIQNSIERVAKVPADDSGEEPDGGTVGDIESMPFVEALNQFRQRAGKGNFVNIHVSYVPVIHGEEKSKPTQHSIRGALQAGLIPDFIACRCERPLATDTIQKIARSCHREVEQVLTVRDMKTVYEVPLLLEQQGLLNLFTGALQLDKLAISPARVEKGAELWQLWNKTVLPKQHLDQVDIAIVGKYVETHDAYLSVVKSLEHSAMRCNKALRINFVDAEHLEDSTQESDPTKHDKAWSVVHSANGVVIPGGFGERGVEGMIKAANWTRTNQVPMLGICLGMQVAVIEAARNLCGNKNATSEEFKSHSKDSVIIFMPEGSRTEKGGTMRLGSRPTHFQPGSERSKLRALYGYADVIEERHRHRYEVNPDHVERLEQAGLDFIGKDDTGNRMEIVELKDHPWYVGVQFHPEYQSKVLDPSRPYLGFLAASAGCLDQITQELLQDTNGILNGGGESIHF